jgi:octaprenyl-diphosphate synthase
VGEIEQSARRYDFDLSEAAYLQVSGAKTASLYASACELGARYPGGRGEIGATMRSFGWEIGLAFQIVDDCLDVVGREEDVGKPVGNDVEDGKVTLPVLYAFRHADEAARARMRDIYTLPGLDRRAERLRAAVDLGPGVEYSMAVAADLARRAAGRVAELPESPARELLVSLGEYVLQRRW